MDMKSLKTINILYVEDDETVVESFGKILKKVFNDVKTALDGEEGLKLFEQNKDTIDFIISDIRMPKMDGLEMIKQIRKIDKDIPCILTTAHGEFDYFVEADSLGVYRYIQKPVNINELFEAMGDYISGLEVSKTEL